MHSRFEMKFLFYDGHQDVDADRDSDLGFHRVVARAVKRFDPQVLFDPAEGQLDLPALGVECGDRCSRKFEVVGLEDKGVVVDRVVKI